MIEIGSEFSKNSDSNYYFKNGFNFGKSTIYFRSGRDGLRYLANTVKKRSGIALLPSYCCYSMIEPFISNGWKVVFYSIGENFIANQKSILNSIIIHNPDLLLIMNYFGFSGVPENLESIKEKYKNIQIIKDITHEILDSNKFKDEYVDHYVGSIRKWFGVIDGGIVISNRPTIHNYRYKINEFVLLRKKGLDLKFKYEMAPSQKLKEEFRKILADAEFLLDTDKRITKISPESLKLLKNFDITTICKARKNNFKYLYSLLDNHKKINLAINLEYGINFNNTPFALPILVNNRDKIQKQLASKGIYTQLIWPLSINAKKTCIFCEKIENKILSLPIDQRYTLSDMDYLFTTLTN